MLVLRFRTLLQILEIAKTTVSYQLRPLVIRFRTALPISVVCVFVDCESLGKSDVGKRIVD